MTQRVWQRAIIFTLGICTLIMNVDAQPNSFIEPNSSEILTENSEYLETVQKATFGYFWDFAHPMSGAIPERTATPNVIATGGTGFGISCIIVAANRKWISREDAVKRILLITNFLETAERFHGAWPHWMNGKTGKVIPFGEKDNGGDLVETAYLVNGLLAARAYFNENNQDEINLRKKITALWESVEWDWYASRGDNQLYWHWSPNAGWAMNMPIRGYNECLITYALALGSPTHPISASVYENTWKKGNTYFTNKDYLGYRLPLGMPFGGPLFFSHYSYLTLDPRLMQDKDVNYWQQNVNHTLINYGHCVLKADKTYGYSEENWGLTASDDYNFYDAHSPDNDNGTISPTAALSAMPYTPYQSFSALRYFYLKKGNPLFGKYGFYDAFNASKNWYSNQYLAIDQGPIVVMIENYRSRLLWKIGESIPELWKGLEKMGIQKPNYPTGFYMYVPEVCTKEYVLMKHPDKNRYVIDFAIGDEKPFTLTLQNEKGEKTILMKDMVYKKGTYSYLFDSKRGKCEAILTQNNSTEKIKLDLK